MERINFFLPVSKKHKASKKAEKNKEESKVQPPNTSKSLFIMNFI